MGRDQDSLPRLLGSLANACRCTRSLGDATVGARPVFIAADLLHAVCVIPSALVIYSASLTKQQIDLTCLGNAYLSHTALVTLFNSKRIQSALIHKSSSLFPTSVSAHLPHLHEQARLHVHQHRAHTVDMRPSKDCFWLKSTTYRSSCSVIGTRGPGCRANLGLIHTFDMHQNSRVFRKEGLLQPKKMGGYFLL